MWVHRGVESLCRLTSNKVPFDLPTNECKSNYCSCKTGFIWKFSREWPLNGVGKLRLTAKETSIAIFEVLDEKCPIAVQGIFVGIIIKASAASIQVTDLLFAFAFCKK